MLTSDFREIFGS